LASAADSIERHLDIVVLGRLLRTGLHRLPELVLEAFRDQRNIDILGYRRGAESQRKRQADGNVHCSSLYHFKSPLVVVKRWARCSNP
jgi:hypothetical protein